MHFANKHKGLFCIAAPDFESTKTLDISGIEYNKDFCIDIIKQIERTQFKKLKISASIFLFRGIVNNIVVV